MGEAFDMKEFLSKVPKKKIIRNIIVAIVLQCVGGFGVRTLMDYITSLGPNKTFEVHWSYFISPVTWLIGFVAVVAVGIIWLFSSNNLDLMLGTGKGLLGKKTYHSVL